MKTDQLISPEELNQASADELCHIIRSTYYNKRELMDFIYTHTPAGMNKEDAKHEQWADVVQFDQWANYHWKQVTSFFQEAFDKEITIYDDGHGELRFTLLDTAVIAFYGIHIITNKNTVSVTISSVMHPMTEVHLIEFVTLTTNKGIYTKYLTAENEPKVTIALFFCSFAFAKE